MIEYTKNDVFHVDSDVIAHRVHFDGMSTSGVMKRIKIMYPHAYKLYLRTCIAKDEKPDDLCGITQMIRVDDGKFIANMYSIGYGDEKDNAALRKCLLSVKENCAAKRIAVPYFTGCSHSDDEWEVIEKMLYDIFGADESTHLIICGVDKEGYHGEYCNEIR